MQLTLTGVGHRFPETPWLFRGLAATLHAGRSYALVGPSGCGKSTLLSLIAAWTTPTEGAIQVRGVDKIGWVFQSPHGMPRRTALDHVVLPLLAAGAERENAESDAVAFLEQVDLGGVAHREFRALSGGEAQRLMLARAAAAHPQLLLVDEPTAQLDVVTARRVNDAIAAMVSPERILVVATHDHATRDACTDRLDLTDFSCSDDALSTSAVATEP
jgi:putative ABC transport system ATP-binding protein/lipoprotein-releasing system ATP-binding protein